MASFKYNLSDLQERLDFDHRKRSDVWNLWINEDIYVEITMDKITFHEMP
jgi:hypothetical protein